MAMWIPILKASLPFLTQIVATAIPAFTSRTSAANKTADTKVDPITDKQIAELQTAVTHNAEAIQGIAERLQQTIEGLEAGVATTQRENAQLKKRLTGAWIISFTALIFAFLAFIKL